MPVKITDETRQLIISPNPFTSSINIKITWNKSENITAKIISLQGSEVITKNIKMNKGVNYIAIDEASDLPPGNYFIQFLSATERFTKKITKQ